MRLAFKASIPPEWAIKIHGLDGLKIALVLDEESAREVSTDEMRKMRQMNLWVTMEPYDATMEGEQE